MQVTEEQYADLLARTTSTVQEHPGKKKYIIVLPFAMPTWNRVLAMNRWQQKKLRDLLHRAVSLCIKYGEGSAMRTISTAKLQLMGFDMSGYLRMIRPKSSEKYDSRKQKAKPAQNALF